MRANFMPTTDMKTLFGIRLNCGSKEAEKIGFLYKTEVIIDDERRTTKILESKQ